jgi:hypothetical protein
MNEPEGKAWFGGRLQLQQALTGHRVGTDAALLAAAAPAGFGGLCVDLGAGVGAVGLAVAALHRTSSVRLVEIDQAAAALAAANVAANGLDAVVEQGVVEAAPVLAGGDAEQPAGIAQAVEQIGNTGIKRLRIERPVGAQPLEGALVILCKADVQIMLGVGQQHLHRFNQAQANNAADGVIRRRRQPMPCKALPHGAQDVNLAVDQRAVAIEHREFHHTRVLLIAAAPAVSPIASIAAATPRASASLRFWLFLSVLRISVGTSSKAVIARIIASRRAGSILAIVQFWPTRGSNVAAD